MGTSRNTARKIKLVFSLLLWCVAIFVMVRYGGWELALAIWLALWANNIQQDKK